MVHCGSAPHLRYAVVATYPWHSAYRQLDRKSINCKSRVVHQAIAGRGVGKSLPQVWAYPRERGGNADEETRQKPNGECMGQEKAPGF